MKFEIVHQSKKTRARVCRIHTPHGTIQTPNFVAVGTNGTIKSLDSKMVNSTGLSLMFCNTYHLMVQPGTKVIKLAGGLHKFMNRDLPLITDSGGFQVFSLAYGSVHDEIKSKGKKRESSSVLKITEEGVLFRSYRDGAKILLTPESSVQAQKDLGADIIIPFDELPPYHLDETQLKLSLDRTHRWEIRSLKEHEKNTQNQSMFAVVHGGMDPELRKKSCEILSTLNFEGFAIGGSVGKNHKMLKDVLEFTRPHLPNDRPCHLLGIGDIPAIDLSIPLGIDTFDSSYPTKAARHGTLLTARGPLKIATKKNAIIFSPIEDSCNCYSCQNYSLSYLHHLFKANELIYFTLATIHNIHFMCRLMQNYQELILHDHI